MKLQGRIPVESLDDERLTNIERRVVMGAVDAAQRAPRRASRRGLGLALALCAAVGGVALGWRLREAPAPAAVAAAAPVRVHTADARSVLDIGDATIESEPGTEYAVTRPDGGVLVGLARGKVELHVGKRGARPPLVVRAGDTDVIVVGTRFSVDYGDGTGDVDVRVTEGVVRVVHHQKEERVAAGQAWTTRSGVVATAALPAREAPSATAGPSNASDPSGAVIGPIATRDDLAVQLDTTGAPTLRDHKAAVPDAPAHPHGDAATTTTATAPRPPRAAAAHPPTARALTGPRGEVTAAMLAVPLAPTLDVGTAKPDEQVAEYRRIVFELKGASESKALYSLAVVQATALGRTGDALSTLEGYLRRFLGRTPQYPELEPVLWLRLRILCYRDLDAACRDAAGSYAKYMPDGPGAHIAERITLGQ